LTELKRYEALPRLFVRDIEPDPGYEILFPDELSSEQLLAVDPDDWVEYVPTATTQGAVEAERARIVARIRREAAETFDATFDANLDQDLRDLAALIEREGGQ
jgi:hypothetical protein